VFPVLAPSFFCALTFDLEETQMTLQRATLLALSVVWLSLPRLYAQDTNVIPPPNTDSNLITNIELPDGTSYTNCRVVAVDPDGINIAHSKGIAKCFFAELPSELRQRFGYDPAAASGIGTRSIVQLRTGTVLRPRRLRAGTYRGPARAEEAGRGSPTITIGE
jgi:hypothetical protein